MPIKFKASSFVTTVISLLQYLILNSRYSIIVKYMRIEILPNLTKKPRMKPAYSKQLPIIICLIIICFVTICCSNPVKKTKPPDNLSGLHEIDSLILNSMTIKITDGDFGKITSFIIEIDGQIVYEHYFRGYTRDDLHKLQSVTKSFASALIGIAVKERFIENINQPLLEFFPEYLEFGNMDARKANITLEHVLQMRAGFQWDEWSTPYLSPESPIDLMMSKTDWIKYVLDLPMDAEPGTAYRYNTGASNLLAGIIKNRTGKSPKEFADEKLFGPLGIEQYEWPTYSNGLNTTGFGLRMRPLDMLKFGELFLNDGIIDNDTLLSVDWISKSIGTYSNMSAGGKYGYQWWLMPTEGRIDQNYIPYASGWGIQHIVFIKSLNMVVVTTGEDWEQEYWPIREILYDYIFRALK